MITNTAYILPKNLFGNTNNTQFLELEKNKNYEQAKINQFSKLIF